MAEMIPAWLNILLGVLFPLLTLGAIVFMARKNQANQATLRGKRNIQEELARSRRPAAK